jgi:predicted DNA-binding protein
MKEQELITEGFERVDQLVEETGDQTDYYFYQLEINPDFVLMSDASDEVNNDQWKVYCYESGIIIKDLEDVQMLIALFGKWTKQNK